MMDDSTGDAPDPWSLRASDADRDGYLELLREAFAEGRLDPGEHEERVEAALSAKTYRDLYQVLAELPVDPQRVPGPPAGALGASGTASATEMAGASAGEQPTGHLVPIPVAEAGQEVATSGWTSDTALTAILGSSERSGRWLVPEVQQATCVLGEVDIDLTSAVLSAVTTEIRCVAILGTVSIVVPDSLRVEVAGTPVLGEFTQKDKRKRGDRRRVPAPDAPVVRITGLAMLGEVKIRIVKPRAGSPPVSLLSGQPARAPEAIEGRAASGNLGIPEPGEPEAIEGPAGSGNLGIAEPGEPEAGDR